MTGLLDGIRVLDLTRALAGPMCTALLSDFGADIFKIEPIDGGDATRVWPPYDQDGSLYFASVNRGKRSMAVNLRTDEGRSLLRSLADQVDVLIENFRPGVLEDMGLSVDELERTNPGLVVVSVSGLGPVGPDRTTAGLDQVAQGMSGLMSVTGMGDVPTRVGVPIVDTLAGVHAALAVCAGLVQQGRAGKGSHVQTSLLETAITAMTFQNQSFLSLGEVPKAIGNDHPTITPYGLFDTADQPINIAVGSESAWRKLCSVLGNSELADDPLYTDGRLRQQHRERLRGRLEELLARRTAAEWVPLIKGAGIPCGPVYSVDQVFDDPQVEALGMVSEVTDPSGNNMPIVRGPFWVDGDPLQPRSAPPRKLGESTETALGDLGVTPETVAELREKGIVT